MNTGFVIQTNNNESYLATIECSHGINIEKEDNELISLDAVKITDIAIWQQLNPISSIMRNVYCPITKRRALRNGTMNSFKQLLYPMFCLTYSVVQNTGNVLLC